MGRKDIYKDGKGFDVNPQNCNRNGRPRNLINTINLQLKNEGYTIATKSHVIEAYQTLINLPLTKVSEIAKTDNDNYPILYKLVAKEMLGKRGGEYLEKIMDRIIGKPKQEMDINTPTEITINLKRGGQ